MFCVANPNSGLPGFVSSSTDLGKTWQQSSAEVDGDSFTICADSSDRKKLYVANEDYAASFNNQSDLYHSDDAGSSWSIDKNFPIPFLSGSMICSKNAIYAASLNNGIYRSIDKGKTWINTSSSGSDTIKSAFDCRNIACVNDNIVFVLDAEGNIWETTNGGGDSVIEKSEVSSSIVKENIIVSSAYPNPSNGQIRIEYTLPDGVATGEIAITNLEGIEVRKYQVGNIFNDILFERSDLPSGTYFYKLVTGKGESEMKKIIVTK
jgi:hypothetical protein